MWLWKGVLGCEAEEIKVVEFGGKAASVVLARVTRPQFTRHNLGIAFSIT